LPGIGITGLINGLDPEVVVIGGEITKAWGLIEAVIVEETRRSLLASAHATASAIRRSAFEGASKFERGADADSERAFVGAAYRLNAGEHKFRVSNSDGAIYKP